MEGFFGLNPHPLEFPGKIGTTFWPGLLHRTTTNCPWVSEDNFWVEGGDRPGLESLNPESNATDISFDVIFLVCIEICYEELDNTITARD